MVAKVVPEPRTCPVCNGIFPVGGGGNARREAVFCSPACRSAGKYNRPKADVHELLIAEAAYLAGLVDGEGHISIYGGYGKSDPHRFRIALGIANTSLLMLDWVRMTTGVGGISSQGQPTPRQKPVFQWNISSENAYAVLAQIKPYLIVKPDRAALVMQFQERLRDPALKADRSWQLEYVDHIRSMNRRGPLVEVA